MRKIRCEECGRKRDPYRAVCQRLDSGVVWLCRSCWFQLEYDQFIGAERNEVERAARARVKA